MKRFMRVSVAELKQCKNKTPLVALTAYTAPMAKLLDPYVDILLVGDSLGMVIYGLPSTVGVTLEQMMWHGRAVVHASQRACVVIDLPAGSYETSPELAVASAKQLIEHTGAQAVKLEGGVMMAPTIKALRENNIDVMAHIGLLPQHVEAMGGYKIQGKSEESAQLLLADAEAVARAGAFAVVIEGVREAVASRITRACPVPTIGIGASAACDGQVLVIDDLLGMNEKPAKFVRPYASLRGVIANAAQNFSRDVRERQFPSTAELY